MVITILQGASMMSSHLFIVEGQMEQKFIQETCGNTMVRLIGAQGDNVALECIASRAASLARMTKAFSGKIFLIIDRENREINAEDMESQLGALISSKIPDADISVHVADRCSESWILADHQLIAKVFNKTNFPPPEGLKAKGKLKKLHKEHGIAYCETTHGVNLLKRCTASTVANNSPSFFRLLTGMKNKGVRCYWLNR